MLQYTKRMVMVPQPYCSWASKMVLNPAMVKDPADGNTLHMLFRATGPYPEVRLPGKPMPYPIFLGYAVSHDRGKSWDCDFFEPAFRPEFQFNPDEPSLITDAFGRRMFNYANGSVEDPRLFYFENELYLSLACRPFPPGPYWDHDDPLQCMPDGFSPFGPAAAENYTVTMLYRVNLAALKKRDYADSFQLIAPLHEPDISDNRDVVLFPRRINGKIVCIHRPKWPWRYELGNDVKIPSIFMAAADSLADFHTGRAEQRIFAVPEFPWEANRIGASWAPLEIGTGEWLLPYHGKQDDMVGYTQSFMILKETGTCFPVITHRPSERLMYASEPWELEGDFNIPCMFTCSGVILDKETLLMGYGAADNRIGIAETGLSELIEYIRQYDGNGYKN